MASQWLRNGIVMMSQGRSRAIYSIVTERAALAMFLAVGVFPDVKGLCPRGASRLSHRAVGHNAKENGQGLTPLPANVRRWAVWSSERPAQGGRSF